MIDNNYMEHHNFDGELFEKDYSIGDKFETLNHEFTFLGKGEIDHGLEPYFELDIYRATDVAGIEQYLGHVTRYCSDDKFDEMTLVLEHSYPDIEFPWISDEDGDFTLIPLESIHEQSVGHYTVTVEIPSWNRKWVSVDPNAHITRLGGHPSFGNAKEYGQPHGKNDSGEWKPLPFIAQYILPDGKFIHIYHVDDPEGYGGNPEQHLLDFGIENPNRSLVLIQDSVIPDGFCLMPLKDGERSIFTENAVAVEGGNWPKSVNYIQGTETDEDYPYTLMHLPGTSGYGEDTDKMVTYTETYIVWDGQKKAKLVEQYD